jgi:zinc/manganese transport system substrate-binding protein
MFARSISFALGLALATVVAARPAAAKLVVVTTTQDPAALTRAVGGDRVDVTALAKGYQDPHFLEAKPSFMVKLNRADLVVIIGLDLEAGYLSALLAGARNDHIMPGQKGFLDLGTVIQPMEVVPLADRGQGDIHPNGNPHYWLDPENGRLMARAIAARLGELDPDGKADYAKNLAGFEKKLDEKEKDWSARMQPLSGQPVITYHRSWSYFARRYNLSVIDFIEPKPGIPPTPAHTLEVIRTVQSKGLKLILMENFYDRRVPDFIAEKTSAHVVVVPNSVGGEDGVDTYFDLLDRITGELAKAFGGKS